jgi:hypothetical protein
LLPFKLGGDELGEVSGKVLIHGAVKLVIRDVAQVAPL